ncbi:MAG: hypothetical protein KDJ40_10565 [Hyphomicrobiales bacterium]|nr:hypothetical protein [Hyphomicrobiales bacterium]MCO5086017.1 hypothetical protein [Methylobacteriaceae bacterium]
MATFAKSLVTAGNAYAGIGSRETPADICALMTQIARVLDARGMILRSGGADGADNAFAIGARIGHREIFTPWKTFQPKAGPFIPDTIPLAGSKYELPALHLAAAYHPTWDVPFGQRGHLTQGAKRLHARNCQQMLGETLGNLSAFVICWTKDARGGGGTGQAIRLARAHGVPVFDLADPQTLASVLPALDIAPLPANPVFASSDLEI